MPSIRLSRLYCSTMPCETTSTLVDVRRTCRRPRRAPVDLTHASRARRRVCACAKWLIRVTEDVAVRDLVLSNKVVREALSVLTNDRLLRR